MLFGEPGHGYNLHRKVVSNLGQVWHLSQSQAYAILKRLETRGEISRHLIVKCASSKGGSKVVVGSVVGMVGGMPGVWVAIDFASVPVGKICGVSFGVGTPPSSSKRISLGTKKRTKILQDRFFINAPFTINRKSLDFRLHFTASKKLQQFPLHSGRWHPGGS